MRKLHLYAPKMYFLLNIITACKCFSDVWYLGNHMVSQRFQISPCPISHVTDNQNWPLYEDTLRSKGSSQLRPYKPFGPWYSWACVNEAIVCDREGDLDEVETDLSGSRPHYQLQLLPVCRGNTPLIRLLMKMFLEICSPWEHKDTG